MDNRITPAERAVLDSARQYFNLRTAENLRHLVFAIRDWIRSERAAA